MTWNKQQPIAVSAKSTCRSAAVAVVAVAMIAGSAQADIFRVDGRAPKGGDGRSWETAFQRVEQGLRAAKGGDEVWVAEGVYTPARSPGRRDKSFVIKKRRALYGGFAGDESSRDERDPQSHVTVLSGDLAGDDGPDFENYDENVETVVRVESRRGRPAVLDGLTIQGGNGETSWGAGVQFASEAEATFRQCVIRLNAQAAGIAVRSQGVALIEDCIVERNEGTGIFLDGVDAIVVRDTRVAENRDSGLRNNKHGTLLIERCVFDGNSAPEVGGAVVATGDRLEIRDSTFTYNQAGRVGGAIFYNRGLGKRSVVANCLIAFNEAGSDGGGVWGETTGVTMVNCTIVGNRSLGNGGGVYQRYPMTIANSVLVGNADSSGQGEGAQLFAPGNVRVWFSVLQGWSGKYRGEGTIDVDPRFVDPENGDFRLSAGSPCIDAADNGEVPEGVTTDVDGNSRFVDDPDSPDTGRGTPPIVDMGAYEFQARR